MENENERRAKLGAFFNAYAQRFNDALQGKPYSIEGITAAFADSFIESSPVGVIANTNDEKFSAMVPKGYEFYKSIGTTGITIKSKEITLLDNLHSMVRVGWKSDYERKDCSAVSIEFDIIYFLTEAGGEPKIFSYIAGDEEKAIKDNGLETYK